MILAAISLLALPAFHTQELPAQPPMQELRTRLVEEINRDRAAHGLRPVEYSEELSRAADAHCREMLDGGYMSHWDRQGRKPYLRYAQAGIRAATQENVWGLWQLEFDTSPASVERTILSGHRSFMAERPPHDGHRRSILDPHHTRVGIGVAYDQRGLRLIELFAASYAALEPLPDRARLKDLLSIEGQLTSASLELVGISVFYEPLPQPMTREQLHATLSYSLPQEEFIERPKLTGASYTDGGRGTIAMDAAGRFQVPMRFWKGQPGVYTVGVWVRSGSKSFLGAMTSLLVTE